MSAQDDLVTAVRMALLEAADQMAWVDLPDKGSEAVLDGRFDLSLLAASLYASGYRPPARVIETAEELSALPNGSVVLGRMSGDLWEFTRISDDCSWWETPGREGTFEADSVDVPATVLWESGDPR